MEALGLAGTLSCSYVRSQDVSCPQATSILPPGEWVLRHVGCF